MPPSPAPSPGPARAPRVCAGLSNFGLDGLIAYKTLGMALPADYHHKQADVLTRLALSARDMHTASLWMQLAAEHATLADGADQLIRLMNLASEKRYWLWPLLLESRNE